jgi:L-iditol 2-dehydrogenase
MHHVRPGDAVVVCGGGPSGNLLMQESLAVGAGCLCALDLHPLRLEMARRICADVAVCAAEGDFEQRVLDAFGEADVFIDATGYDVYDLAIRLLKDGGRLVTYGVPDSGVHYNGTRAYFKNIEFCRSDKSDWPRIVAAGLELVRQGKIDLGAFTTHHFTLDEVPAAVRMALDEPDQCLGLVIDVESSA